MKTIWAMIRIWISTCLLGLATASLAGAAADEESRRFDHVYVIVLENHGFDDAFWNGPSPFLRDLAGSQGLATRYFGVAHPSLPNYLAMIGGDDFGVRDDQPSCFASDISVLTACHKVAGDSLADQLVRAGLTYALYAESLPEAGSLVATGPNGFAGSLYAQKHNPFPYFEQFAADLPARARMKPFEALAQDLAAGLAPNFALIVPNQCHDGHGLFQCRDRDQLIADYDAFVRQTVTSIRASKNWTEKSAIVVTFDEGVKTLYADAPVSEAARRVAGADNHVATVVVTPCGGPTRDDTRYDHFSLLATIEDGFGLPRLRKAQEAASMAGLFDCKSR